MVAKGTTIFDDQLSLSFVNQEDTQEIKICFERGFLSLRESDEFCYEKSMDDLNTYFARQNNTKEKPWFLFTVANSEYIESFRKEGSEVYDDMSIVHYVIVTDDVICEILSTVAPNIEVFDKV